MVQPRGSPRLPQEAFAAFGAGGHPSVNDLEGHGAAQHHVQGFVGDAHGAPAQLLEGASRGLRQLEVVKPALLRHPRPLATPAPGPKVQRPLQQAHRAVRAVISGGVRRAAGRAGLSRLGPGLRQAFSVGAHAGGEGNAPSQVRTRPSAATSASRNERNSSSTSFGSSTVRSTSARTSWAWRWRSRWIRVFTAGTPTWSARAAPS